MSVVGSSNPPLRYGLAVAVVFLVLLLTVSFQPLLDRSLFLLFFGAVVLSAWFGGVGPGLLAVGLSVVACQYVLVQPAGISKVGPPQDLVRLFVLSVSLTVCVLISARLRTEARMRRLVDSNIVVTKVVKQF